MITSVPLEGPTARAGSDAAEAAALAVSDGGNPVERSVLDAGPFGERVRDNALRAAGDPDVVGYLGELHSAATEVSLPLLEAAGVPHLSFSNTLRTLEGSCFVNVMPDDERAATAVVAWMLELGVRAPVLVDDGEDYGADMRRLVGRGLAAADVAEADAGRPIDAVFLGAVAGRGTVELLERVHQRAASGPVFGVDGLVTDGFAKQLPPEIAERLRVVPAAAPPEALPADGRAVTERLAERLGHRPDPHAIYAYEAMSLLLDALAGTGADRAATVARLRSTRGRDSVLGRYDIDGRGATTLPARGRLRIEGGRFASVS